MARTAGLHPLILALKSLNENLKDVVRNVTVKQAIKLNERSFSDDVELVGENINDAVNSIHDAIGDLDSAAELVGVMSLSAELKRVPADLRSKLMAIVRAAEKWQKQFEKEA